jgi:hypothetical protein
MPAPERQARDDRLLVALQQRVNEARADVQQGRSLPPAPQRAVEQQRRYEQLAGALEAYADAASNAGVPLPYRYRDEMRLYRAMYPRAKG